MQVFLPDANLNLSASYLDDLRLSKQITEINQIVLTYVNQGGGHAEHLVSKHYRSLEGARFLLEYSEALCKEYERRKGKKHMGEFTSWGLSEYLENVLWINLKRVPSFKPAYLKGIKGINQVIDEDNYVALYRNLLCEKWVADKATPTWLNSTKPAFYTEYRKALGLNVLNFACTAKEVL